MTAEATVKALMRLGVLPPDYALPLTYERARGLRLFFLHENGRASQPARFDRAAKLCGLYIDAMEREFWRHPQTIHARWQRPL